MPDLVRLCAPGVSLRFAPFYLAEEIGAFARGGLTIEWSDDGGAVGSLIGRRLLDGVADIGCGGLWLHLMYRGTGIADFTHPDVLCHRHPGVVVSRAPVTGFSWKDFYGKTVLSPLAGSGQAMLLEGVFREQNLDIGRVKRVRDIHLTAALDLWRAGLGDFFVADMAGGEKLIGEGGHLAAELADAYGDVPFTIFYSLEAKSALLARFRAGVEEGLRAILAERPVESARRIAKRFPAMDLPRIERALAELIRLGVWKDTTAISPAGYERYQRLMIAYGAQMRML